MALSLASKLLWGPMASGRRKEMRFCFYPELVRGNTAGSKKMFYGFPLAQLASLICVALLLSGCVRELSLGGIYIPAWLLCSIIGLIVGSIVSNKAEPYLVPEPGYFQMLLRFSFIVIFFIIFYMGFFVLL